MSTDREPAYYITAGGTVGLFDVAPHDAIRRVDPADVETVEIVEQTGWPAGQPATYTRTVYRLRADREECQ